MSTKYIVIMMIIMTMTWNCVGTEENGMTPSIDEVIEKIQKGDRYEIREALTKVSSFGKDGMKALSAVRMCLTHEDPFIRSAAAITIDEMNAENVVFTELIKLLDDKDRYFGPRFYAALAIGDMGPEATDAIPKLIELLEADDPSRWAAAEALGEIGDAAKEAIPKLEELLEDESELVRVKAKEAIDKITKGDC
jgi:HEAT repeat protein